MDLVSSYKWADSGVYEWYFSYPTAPVTTPIPYPKFLPADADALQTADGSIFYVPLQLLVMPTDADNFVTSDGYTLYTYSSS